VGYRGEGTEGEVTEPYASKGEGGGSSTFLCNMVNFDPKK